MQRLSERFNPAIAERVMRWAESPINHVLMWDDPAYPTLLKNISKPPRILFVKGNVQCLTRPQLAIVGSRHPTPTGLETAYAFARDLAKQGLVITSGLAIGVDGASHRGALAASGTTVAVLGSGIDHIYPRRHCALAEKIIERGALVSEYPLETTPKPYHFPLRNRIISGLALGVLVAEAKLKSGSLITAQQALEAGRDVFAIPSSIHNPMAKGCHELLRQGACLVQQTSDIWDELSIQPQRAGHKPLAALSINCLDNDKQKLVKCVGYDATSVEIITNRSGFSPQLVNVWLVELEMAGYIRAVPGGYMRENS